VFHRSYQYNRELRPLIDAVLKNAVLPLNFRFGCETSWRKGSRDTFLNFLQKSSSGSTVDLGREFPEEVVFVELKVFLPATRSLAVDLSLRGGLEPRGFVVVQENSGPSGSSNVEDRVHKPKATDIAPADVVTSGMTNV
jgi:hypothetical protein